MAFEDASDAEFVAATLRANLEDALRRQEGGSEGVGDSVGATYPTAGQTASSRIRSPLSRGGGSPTRYSVLPGSPMFLEDMARLQGARLGVVPPGVLSRSARLPDLALEQLLAGIVTGKSLTAAPYSAMQPARESPPGDNSDPLTSRRQQAGVLSSSSASRINLPQVEDFPGFEGRGESDDSVDSHASSQTMTEDSSDLGASRAPPGRRGGQSMASLSSPNTFKFEFNGFKAPSRKAESSIRREVELTRDGDPAVNSDVGGDAAPSVSNDVPSPVGAPAGPNVRLDAPMDDSKVMELLRQMDERVGLDPARFLILLDSNGVSSICPEKIMHDSTISCLLSPSSVTVMLHIQRSA